MCSGLSFTCFNGPGFIDNIDILYFRNPPLDPKFLMKRDEAIPVRGILHQHSNASKTHSPTSETNTMVASYTNTNMRLNNVPPLASAYFPGQS